MLSRRTVVDDTFAGVPLTIFWSDADYARGCSRAATTDSCSTSAVTDPRFDTAQRARAGPPPPGTPSPERWREVAAAASVHLSLRVCLALLPPAHIVESDYVAADQWTPAYERSLTPADAHSTAREAIAAALELADVVVVGFGSPDARQWFDAGRIPAPEPLRPLAEIAHLLGDPRDQQPGRETSDAEPSHPAAERSYSAAARSRPARRAA